MKRELAELSTAQMPNATEEKSLNTDESEKSPSAKKQRIDEKEEEDNVKVEHMPVVVVMEAEPKVSVVEEAAGGAPTSNDPTPLPDMETSPTDSEAVLLENEDEGNVAEKTQHVAVEERQGEVTELEVVATSMEETNQVDNSSAEVDAKVMPRESTAVESKVKQAVIDDIDGPQKDSKSTNNETKQEDDVGSPTDAIEREDDEKSPMDETKQENDEESPKDVIKEKDVEESTLDETRESAEKVTEEVLPEGKNLDGKDSIKTPRSEEPADCGGEAIEKQGVAVSGSKDAVDEPGSSTATNASAGRRLTFPEKLMELLNSEEYRESMAWIPNGNAFALNPPKFMKDILPKHFEGTKFESFTRKLNRWGFKRIAGEDAPEETFAYSHHLFKRDYPELCRGMSGGKKMEQDFSHLIRYRERERLIMATTSNPGTQGNLGFGGMPGAPGPGMQAGLSQQLDAQRMLLKQQQIAASGGMGRNLYGNFGGGGGFERELAIREMLLRQEAASGQNANAAFFQQQQFGRFGQGMGPGQMPMQMNQLQMNQMQMNQMQMHQMQMAQMGQVGQMTTNQIGLPGAGQVPGSFEASMMATGAGTNGANAAGGGAPSTATQQQQLQQQQQQNMADLKMVQEQRLRIQQQLAMHNAAGGGNPAFNAGTSGGGRTCGI